MFNFSMWNVWMYIEFDWAITFVGKGVKSGKEEKRENEVVGELWTK